MQYSVTEFGNNRIQDSRIQINLFATPTANTFCYGVNKLLLTKTNL